MPATVTFRTLLEELAEQAGVGKVLPEIDPDNVDAGSLTLATGYASGPWAGQGYPRGSPIFITSPADGGTATASTTTTITDSTKAWATNEWISFVVRMGGRRGLITSNTATALTFATMPAAPTVGVYSIEFPEAGIDIFTPSTGVIAVLPAWGSTDGAQNNPFTAIVITETRIDHSDRLKDAINRALAEHCFRWEPRPLTFLPDGDLQGTTVTDYWTAAANGTAAYASAQIYPAGSAADVFGVTGINRLVQLTSSGGSTSMDSNGVRVVLSTAQRTWYFQTAIRLVSGTGTVTLSFRDNTNAAAITTQVMRGNDAGTLTITNLGDFLICEGTFQLPATCAEIAVRLALSATGMVAQMSPVILYPPDTYAFPIPNRVVSEENIGNFREGWAMAGPGGLQDIAFGEPLTLGGRTAHLDSYGDHMTVRFNFRASRPIWYDEAVYGPTLTALTDTTTFYKDYVVAWAKWELYKSFVYKDAPTVRDAPVTSPWVRKANAAKRAAEGFHPPLLNIPGRV